MLKGVRFTTTWLGQLCTSTIWRGSYPSSSHPLNMKTPGMPPAYFRLERPASRGLHTFVPLPTSGPPPTMVSHGGIPSHMVINPEPNLRPMPARPPPNSEPMLTTGSPPPSNLHVRSRSRSNSGYHGSCGTSSFEHSNYNPSPSPV